MNKDFFDQLDQRKQDFAQRSGVGDDVRTALVLGNGRTYVVEKVIDANDQWLHVDVRDTEDESRPRSIVLPYYQITQVLFELPPARMRHAGFSR